MTLVWMLLQKILLFYHILTYYEASLVRGRYLASHFVASLEPLHE